MSGASAAVRGTRQTRGGSVLKVRLRQESPIPIDVAFACEPHDVVAIFGPSGSGKTTILRAVAGFHSGGDIAARDIEIVVGDTAWSDTARAAFVPPHERRVGFVFQDYALFPHLTAVGNVELALTHVPAGQRRARAEALLARVHLAEQIARRPHQLSGGERQRVALARALARDPEVLLLDEPFAAVDRPTRRLLRAEVDDIRRALGVPTVLVTHDLEDVVRLATHLLVLERGRTVAFGPLADVTSRPDLHRLRDLIGVGSVIDAIVASIDSARGLTTLAFDGGTLLAPRLSAAIGDRVRVRIPAREVILADRAPSGLSLHNILRATVAALSAEEGSAYVVVQLTVGSTTLLAEVTRDAVARLPVRIGRELYVLIKSVALEL